MSHVTAAPRLAARAGAASELLGRLLGALRDWRLPLLAALCALGLLAAYQAPLRFSFSVGHDGGPHTDRPFLEGFRPAELTTLDNRWRWTFPEASVVVPGVGTRPLVLGFTVVAHRQDFQPDAPPTVLAVDTGAGAPVQLTLPRGPARRYQLYVPAGALDGGTLRVGLSTARWQNQGDERAELGVAIGGPLTLDEAGGRRPVLPGGELLALPLATALLWLACRAAGIRPNTALWSLVALLAVVTLIALSTPPRLAASARWAVEAALIALGAAVAGALLVPPLLARWRIPVTPRALRWLVLLVAVSFTIKYGGQLHPVAMRGDLQLHVHRFSRTVSGEVYIPAQHRGLPFPFPSGWYAGIAPLTLTGVPVRDLFEVTAGLFEATAVVLAYIMLARVTGSAAGGLLGAVIYTLSPVWLLNIWWAFHTQVASQWFLLALMTLLVVRWPDYDDPLVWGWTVALLVLVSLSHIGSFLNLGAAAVVALPWLWLRARDPAERRAARRLLWAGVAAGLFVILFYYSAFAEKIAAQVTGIAAEGMVGVTEKPPVPADVLLRSLWQDGLIEHYGFFIVVLGVAGAALASLWPRERQGALPPLLWATFTVVLLQALLPLLTQSSVTTRYLTFGGWAFTAGATVAGLRLWRGGPAGRAALTAMLAYAAWVSVEIWIGAMALNAWPAEPF